MKPKIRTSKPSSVKRLLFGFTIMLFGMCLSFFEISKLNHQPSCCYETHSAIN